MIGFRVGLLLLSLFGSRVIHAASSVSQPLPECRQAWSKLIPNNQHHFAKPETYQAYKARVNRGACQKDWTVLVFMAAPQDLTPYAMADIYEMEAGFQSGRYAGSTLKTDMLVQLDSEDNAGLRRLHIFQSPTVYDQTLSLSRLQSMRPEDIYSPVVETKPENSTRKNQLSDFLKWGIQNYPAKNYAVIVWGHGQGYLKVFGESGQELEAEREFSGQNFTSQVEKSLSARDLSEVFSGVRNQTGMTKPFDLFVADACLMQQMEVAYEISRDFRYIVGSPQVHNFYGLPYRRIFYEMNRGSFLGLRQSTPSGDEGLMTALMIPEMLKSSFNIGGFRGLQSLLDPEGFRDLSMTSLSTAEFAHFLRAWNQLSQTMMTVLSANEGLKSLVVEALETTPVFAPELKDIGLFTDNLKLKIDERRVRNRPDQAQLETLIQPLNEVKSSLNRMVIKKIVGPGWAEQQPAGVVMSGVSMWLPTAAQYPEGAAEFEKSHFFQTMRSQRPSSSWPDVLKLLYP